MGKKQKQLSLEEQRERAEARRIANGLADGKLDSNPPQFNGSCNKCGKQGHRASDCKGQGSETKTDTKVGKGHKQRGAGAVLTARGPVETRSGVVKKDWQRLPTQLLNEYCQREKRPKPIYHSPREMSNKTGKGAAEEDEEDWKKYINPHQEESDVDDGLPKQYRQRVMLPDPKFKERSLTFQPSQTSPTKELAKEHTALLALLHVCGDLPLERKLPDEFREVWIASQSNKDREKAIKEKKQTSSDKNKQQVSAAVNDAKTEQSKNKQGDSKVEVGKVNTDTAATSSSISGTAMSLSADSKFASKADRRMHEMKRDQLNLERQRKREAMEKANADVSVLMSNKMRLMIEMALGMKSDSNSKNSKSEKEKAFGSGDKKDDNVVKSSPSSSVVSFNNEIAPYGFTQLDVSNALNDSEATTALTVSETMSSTQASSLFTLFHRLLSYIAENGTSISGANSFTLEEYAESVETEVMILESMYADCFVRNEIVGFGSIVTISPHDLPIVDILIPDKSFGDDGSKILPVAFLTRGITLQHQFQLVHKYHDLFSQSDQSEPPSVLADMFACISECDIAVLTDPRALIALSELGPSPLMAPTAATSTSMSELTNEMTGLATDSISIPPAPPNNDTNTSSKVQSQGKHRKGGFWDTGNVSVKLGSEKVPESIKSSRQSLPASKAKQEILDLLSKHQTLLVAGGTGCGKTTQVPQFIMEEASSSSRHVKIVVAQPRRIAAIGVATRVHEEMGEANAGVAIGTKGSKVGFMVRGDSKVNADSCSLLFCTTGVLLQRMKSDHNLEKITHLVVDEVHERHVDSDFLLAALKRILLERPDMKLIMMSATIDTNKFSKYFTTASAPPSKGGKKQMAGEGCPIITIPGFAHPVTSFYLEDVSELTGLMPRNLAIMKSNKATQSNTQSNTQVVAAKKVAEVRDDWESMDVNMDIDDIDQDEEDDEEEVDNDGGIADKNDLKRFGEVAKSMKSGSELGGSIDATVTCDCKLIQSLIYKVISQGMHKGGSFLVFLPGVGEISKLCDVLNGKGKRNNYYGSNGDGVKNTFKNYDASVKLLVLPLHGGLSPRDQLEVFKTPRHGTIKIVVATNIAETSITIPDCTVVIDSTRVKQTGFDAVRGSSYLALDWAAKDALNQRKGRAGRVAPGICFRMVPKKLFDWLPDHTVPEISRIPLEELVLLVKASGFGNPQRFLSTFLDPPPVNAVVSAITSLKELQALAPPSINKSNDKGREDGGSGGGLELTPLGRHLSQLPCSASIGKLLIMGALLNVLEPVLNIAAAMSVRSPINSLQNKQRQAFMLKKKQEWQDRYNARNIDDDTGVSVSSNKEDDDLYDELNRVDEAGNRINLQKLSNCGRSDHCFIAAVIDCWLICGNNGTTSKSSGRKELCEGLGLSYIKMVEIEQLRHQYKEALASLGFHVHDFKQRTDSSATSSLEALKSFKELGFRSVTVVRRSLNEWRVINAVLLSSLWPNIVKIRKPIQKYHDTAQGALETDTDVKELKFEIQRLGSSEESLEQALTSNNQSNAQGGKGGKGDGNGKGGGKGGKGVGIRMLIGELVAIHPSSLLFKENKYASPWLVYSECITTSRKFLCSVSECAPYAMLLFGGKLNVENENVSIETPLFKSSTFNQQKSGEDGDRQLMIKKEILKWCRVQAPPEVSNLVQHLRYKMDELLEAKIINPSLSIHEDDAMIAMVRLLITEGLG